MAAAVEQADRRVLQSEEALLAVLGRAAGLGFLGPAGAPPQLAHARVFLGALAGLGDLPTGLDGAPQGRAVAVDLGTGGGIPGLVGAVAFPAVDWLLVEANRRRAAFLEDAVRALALGNASVMAGRAEELGRSERCRGVADLVTARSFGPPTVVAECAAAFLKVGGALVVSEPPGAEDDRWGEPLVAAVGLELETTGPRSGPAAARGLSDAVAHVAVLRQRIACPPRFPRRANRLGDPRFT